MNILPKLKQLPLYEVYKYPSRFSFVILLSLITLMVMYLEPALGNLLRYQSAEVNQGEWWRILTANLCHSNWNHWLLNILGLWLMDLFYQPVLNQKRRFQLLFFCMVANVLLLHALLQIHWYVGLSGALHGYLIGGALLSFRTSRKLNSAIILITTLKLFVENRWEINASTESLIGANVLEEAHLFGGLSALMFCAGYYLLKKNPN